MFHLLCFGNALSWAEHWDCSSRAPQLLGFVVNWAIFDIFLKDLDCGVKGECVCSIEAPWFQLKPLRDTKIEILAAVELIFLMEGSTGLCFGFVLTTLLITQGCFSSSWAGLAQSPFLHLTPLPGLHMELGGDTAGQVTPSDHRDVPAHAAPQNKERKGTGCPQTPSLSKQLLSRCWKEKIVCLLKFFFPHQLVRRAAWPNFVELLIWADFLLHCLCIRNGVGCQLPTSLTHLRSYFIWLRWAIFVELFLDFYLKSIGNGYLSFFCALWLF